MVSMASRQVDLVNNFPKTWNQILKGKRLIVASNRGPIEHEVGPDGKLRISRGSGGVVTALASLGQYIRATSICSAMTEGDQQAAQSQPEGCTPPGPWSDNLRVRFVSASAETYARYYSDFSNPLLWFLQHSMWDQMVDPPDEAQIRESWRDGYVPVNQAFAWSVVQEALRPDASPYIMFHDYHLYLVAGYVRPYLPRAILQHFVHIPWPTPQQWGHLPFPLVRAILRGLLANDIVGLQTMASVRNFLSTCEAFLGAAEVDYIGSTVTLEGQRTWVEAYPISVDVADLRDCMASHEVQIYRNKLKALCGNKHTIVRVDRLDPSKNILRGFEAFDLLLRQHPDLRKDIKLLCFLVPCRDSIPEYRDYSEKALQIIEHINQKYGEDGWRPIEVFHENNYPQALAAMSLYDVLLVNPVEDGMNLVSKEGPVVNDRQGVLVLSKGAGAFEQLNHGAISVEPEDVEGTADALWVALNMPSGEKAMRLHYLRRSIEREDVSHWLISQLEDMGKLMVDRESQRQYEMDIGTTMAGLLRF